ncbi:MAG: hypothetical protein ACTSPK_03125 [Candidatus Heimdallarchaeota archaeon]
MSRKMSRKTKFFTVLSVWMIFQSIGLAIPCVVEGINIARNYYNFELNNEVISPGSFVHSKFDLRDEQRINLDIRSWTAGGSTYSNPAKVIISIMAEDNFTDWLTGGSQVPVILNSTYYYNSSNLNVVNLKASAWNVYYIVVYNANVASIEADVSITILPWGHIMAISILGFLLIMSLLPMSIQFITAAYYNSEDYLKKISGNDKIVKEEKKAKRLHQESDERYCVSCGATITPKDGQYCPNCGASLGN